MTDETTKPQLTARHMGRYQRQMVLPEVGIDGQRQLLASRVLVVGAGALGSAAATYLAAAGVGTLGLVDGDMVDLSNLHRQILYDESQIGQPKTQSGARRLREVNSDVRIQEHPDFLSSTNVLGLFANYDLIVNGSDNFPTRYLVNDAAVFLQKPLIDSAILRFEGQLSVFRPGLGCYRCLFPTPAPPGEVPDCADAGIFGAVAGVLGSMQAVEALKVLLNIGHTTSSMLLIYDALDSRWHRIAFSRDPECAVCGDNPSVTAPIDYDSFCGVASLAGREVSKVQGGEQFSVAHQQAVRLMSEPGLTILDVRKREEFMRGHIPHSVHCALEDLDQVVSGHGTSTPMLVVCATGVRSAYAVQYLRSRGYEAWTLAGGMHDWSATGGRQTDDG
ncbi:MAG: molybdopterin-synthase adenylyltransferase MoeB [Sulfobacillus sp.]